MSTPYTLSCVYVYVCVHVCVNVCVTVSVYIIVGVCKRVYEYVCGEYMCVCECVCLCLLGRIYVFICECMCVFRQSVTYVSLAVLALPMWHRQASNSQQYSCLSQLPGSWDYRQLPEHSFFC